ncbi:MAG: response regulator transcription factor [Planctomycetes bacterium]|nr:response regulator transcription factor [Planctomycetota bacterium]
MEKILVVEDEPDLLMGLQDNLELEGYQVATAQDGQAALDLAMKACPDLILLDIMLPKVNGFEVLRQLRQKGLGAPVIMLTAKSQEVDRVLGLELGADDYITKPFSVRELLARIKAVLRRRNAPTQQLDAYKFGDVTIDFRKSVATKGRQTIELSHYEAGIMRLLIASRGEPISRNRILDEVWGYELYPTTRTIDNHVVKLRQKLEDDPHNPAHILTVHGMGYKFVD